MEKEPFREEGYLREEEPFREEGHFREEEPLIDTEKFESFVRAIGRAAEQLIEKREKKKERVLHIEKKRASAQKKGISPAARKKIISEIKKLDKLFDKGDKRIFYFKQKFYELTTRPKRDEQSISVFLKNLDDELKGYLEWKREREKKFRALELKIKKKMEEKMKPEKIKQLENRLTTLKRKYAILKKSDKKKDRQKREEIERIKQRLELFEKKLHKLRNNF